MVGTPPKAGNLFEKYSKTPDLTKQEIEQKIRDNMQGLEIGQLGYINDSDRNVDLVLERLYEGDKSKADEIRQVGIRGSVLSALFPEARSNADFNYEVGLVFDKIQQEMHEAGVEQPEEEENIFNRYKDRD